MWIKFSKDYVAGILTGAGTAIFFLALAARSGVLSSGFLVENGALFCGLAFVLGGGGMKWRAQAETETPVV